ncbi:MAG: hypothetical protein K6E20_00340 [Acholeplasmatales bacterium]|nr:hypothetical protein [Acholeplasmatales bacterium]
MDQEKLKKDLDNYIGSVNIPDISCCEDDTRCYCAYNNVNNMYDVNELEEFNINIFKCDLRSLAQKLNVNYDDLDYLFTNNHIPSKGLSIAIMIAEGYDINRIIENLSKLKYNLGSSVSDKIIRYFITNDIRDIDLLNDMLISYGQMYLFSRKKLR